MMSREDGAYGKHIHNPLMSNIDIDLDNPKLESPPSPPLRVQDMQEKNGEQELDDDAPPKTPFYDYACTSHPPEEQLTAQMKSPNCMGNQSNIP